jgi:hypothetical protein
LTRRERLRRVVILCASFARNVAYFRAGQSQTGSAARASSHAGSAFWTQVGANFLDISVLEWCKLLGDEKDKHFWRNVVTDPAAFEASLLASLGMTASDFVDLAKKMRRYRDKFVAGRRLLSRMRLRLNQPRRHSPSTCLARPRTSSSGGCEPPSPHFSAMWPTS